MSDTAHTHQEDEFHSRLDTGMWLKLFRRARAMPRYLVPLIATAIFIAAAETTLSFMNKWVIDGVDRLGRDAPFALYITAFLALAALTSGGVWVFIEMAGNLSNRLAHDIRRDGFDRLQELEFAFYDTRPVGWLISRLTSDCDRLARIIAWGTLDIVWGSVFVTMIAAALLWINWRLGLIVLSVLPPLAFVSYWFQKRMLLSAREIRKYNSRITAGYNESIQGVRTTKTLVREAANLGEFKELTTRMLDASVRNARQSSLYYPIVATLGALAGGLALWHGGVLVNTRFLGADFTVGTLILCVQLAGMFFHPINQMARILTEMQAAQAAGERVLGLLATEPKIKDGPAVLERVKAEEPKAANRADGNTPPISALSRSVRIPPAPDGLPARIDTVEFRDVTFRYENGPVVLQNFNLTVRAGDTIALVGPSGGGKSTIVSLVCRFYEPVSGSILINGIDYRERPLQWFQSQLGIVLQAPHLFKGSVRENIRYGRLGATDAEIENAARLVNAHGFITQLDRGYDTEVGAGGNRLSTGQKQLISFARALLADPQIFVMDEATSSIDTETEQLIQRGLETVFAGRISFVIAHRLSTIRNAARILVIGRGRIEESGTHAELLARRGHYHELYTSQFKRERLEAALNE
ncbi:ABC transporter ATP-binding protein/permease [Termitidicoccus mucosus]|uniref:ABC transporter ATP-binding protein n=1 Tax=Termitidicoccus mucosus TaxID=1184151 RepID=A0A178IPB1_9BACT|nr:ABC transporter ATP-binding protein [Opitutaceae bacterium TSB47]